MIDRFQSISSAIAVLIVDFVAVMGLSIDTDLLVDILSAVAFIIATIYGIWKNHNFTDAAIEGQRLVNALKENVELPIESNDAGERCIVWRIPLAGDEDED